MLLTNCRKVVISAEWAGRNCLWSSMMILRQTRTFSSLSISNNLNVKDKMFLAKGFNISVAGSRWIISRTNFLTCWMWSSAMKCGLPSWKKNYYNICNSLFYELVLLTKTAILILIFLLIFLIFFWIIKRI